MLIELATLTFRPESTSAGIACLDEYLNESREGELVGSFQSEISRWNVALVLRRYENIETLLEARIATLHSSNPFGCGELLHDMSLETYVPFPGFESVDAGSFGPYYEFRSYLVPPGGIAPTIDAWGEMIPRRSIVSAPTLIMYALDGSTRFTHIWAYKTLEERENLRAEAWDRGLWPPSSAPRWLRAEMKTEVFLPTKASPLQ